MNIQRILIASALGCSTLAVATHVPFLGIAGLCLAIVSIFVALFTNN